MKQITVTTILSLFVAGAALARIGETPEQITGRYGRPVGEENRISTNHVARTYATDDFDITVDFVDDKSAGETFSKKTDAQFTPAEIDGLLKANSKGQEWQTKASGSLQQKWWLRDDGKLGAIYFAKDDPAKMWIFENDFIRLLKDEKDRRGKDLPAGF